MSCTRQVPEEGNTSMEETARSGGTKAHHKTLEKNHSILISVQRRQEILAKIHGTDIAISSDVILKHNAKPNMEKQFSHSSSSS